MQAKIDGLITKYKEWLEKDLAGLAAIESQLKSIDEALQTIKTAVEAAKQTNTHYTLQAYIKGYLNII